METILFSNSVVLSFFHVPVLFAEVLASYILLPLLAVPFRSPSFRSFYIEKTFENELVNQQGIDWKRPKQSNKSWFL
jgi:hypothetical protein